MIKNSIIWFVLSVGAGNMFGQEEMIQLFSGAEYAFQISVPDEEGLPENGVPDTLRVTACINSGDRYKIFVSKTQDFLDTSSVSVNFEKNTEPEKIIKLPRYPDQKYHVFTLWRSVGKDSPSGILVESTVVSFPLKVTSLSADKP